MTQKCQGMGRNSGTASGIKNGSRCSKEDHEIYFKQKCFLDAFTKSVEVNTSEGQGGCLKLLNKKLRLKRSEGVMEWGGVVEALDCG